MRTLILFTLIFQIAFFANAEIVAPVASSSSTPAEESGDYVSRCVSKCMEVTQTNSEAATDLFQRNCGLAKRDVDEISSLIGFTKRTGELMAKFTYRCAPQAIVKAGVGLWEGAQALTSLVGYMFTHYPNNEKERLARKKFNDDCSVSQACQIAVARNLTNFSQKNPDGKSYVVPDSEVKTYLAGTNYKALSFELQNEISRLRPHCDTQYNIANQIEIEANNGVVNFETRRKTFDRLVAIASYCPGIMNLAPPEMENDAIDIPPPQTPYEKLSIVQKIAVGYGCTGEDFEIAAWDACSTGLAFLVPIPIAEAAALALRATKALRALALARGATSAIKILDHLPAGHIPISTLENGILTKTVDEKGVVTGYQIVKADGTIERQRMDPSGFAMSANNGTARELAYKDLASGEKSAIFLDVNNLGVVNYFQNGSAAGDAYLAGVAKVLDGATGPNGSVYRWGGDEFMVVVNTTDPTELQALTQRMSDLVFDNPETKAIFRAEKEVTAARYASVMEATSYSELPASLTADLTPQEITFAESNFGQFKTVFAKVEQARFVAAARTRSSISIGSSTIKPGQTPQQTISLANEGANSCKIAYKIAIGADVSKYIGRTCYLPSNYVDPRNLPRLNSRPIAPPPL